MHPYLYKAMNSNYSHLCQDNYGSCSLERCFCKMFSSFLWYFQAWYASYCILTVYRKLTVYEYTAVTGSKGLAMKKNRLEKPQLVSVILFYFLLQQASPRQRPGFHCSAADKFISDVDSKTTLRILTYQPPEDRTLQSQSWIALHQGLGELTRIQTAQVQISFHHLS